MSGGGLTRRFVLAGGVLVPAFASAAGAPPRVAALDWGLAATVAALGAGPFALAECDAYRHWVREPKLPSDIVELGLRTGPSFETLAALRPELILINALNSGLRSRLERIAPTYANAIFAEEHAPIERAAAAALDLGLRLGRADAAHALVEDAEAHFAAARERLAGSASRALVPVSFVDARHVRVFGPGSLFVDVMTRLGLRAGWTRPAGVWGFSVIPVETLATCGNVDILVVEPIPDPARRAMAGPGLWSALMHEIEARVLTVPPTWAFGDLTAATRWAELLAAALDPPRLDGSDG